jgi:hypothetical protein
MTRVALDGIKGCSIFKVSFALIFCAKVLASSVDPMMAESMVKVFPRPISSARIPPPDSTGFSQVSLFVMI